MTDHTQSHSGRNVVTNELLVFRINGEVSEADGGRASDDVECEMRRTQHVDDDR